jgi:DNA anti-recombination protein RmuC
MDPTPQFIGLLVVGGIALIPAINAIRDWSGAGQARRLEPDPLNINLQQPPVSQNHQHPENQTEGRCSLIHAQLNLRFDDLAREVRASLQEHDRKAEDRTSEVHDRINGLVQSVNDKITEQAAAVAGVQAEIRAHCKNHARGA